MSRAAAPSHISNPSTGIGLLGCVGSTGVTFVGSTSTGFAAPSLNKSLSNSFTVIEINNNSEGRPFAVLYKDDEVLNNLGIDISLNHSDTSAQAIAVVYL